MQLFSSQMRLPAATAGVMLAWRCLVRHLQMRVEGQHQEDAEKDGGASEEEDFGLEFG
jgi:hypothetical protein